jgi:hypothetical protein
LKGIVKGESVNTSKLKPEQVLIIRSRAASGESGTMLALEFGISQANACSIINLKTWKNI